MATIAGRGVAIVTKLDTGIIKSSAGPLVGDECEVLCDRGKRLHKCESIDLVTEEMGNDHYRFDAAELETDIREFFGKKYPHLTITVSYWEKNDKRPQRIASFKFHLKKNEKNRHGDPFYVHVINGNPIVRTISLERA